MSSNKEISDELNNKLAILKKGKQIPLKLVVAFVCSFVISLILENLIFEKQYIYFSLDRIGIFTVVIMFIFIHFIFKLKEMYEFIYKKRFWIALILLIVLVTCRIFRFINEYV